MTKPMDDYKEIGQRFIEINDKLVKLIVMVGAFGTTKYADPLNRALEKINQVRSDLEEEMFIDFPDQSTPDIFYGPK